MKKIIFFFLFLTACTGTPGQSPIFTGTEGLTIEFTEGFPDDEVYEVSPLPVSLEIQNKGTWNVLPSRLLLSWSFDPLYLSNNGVSQVTYPADRLMHGRSEYYPAGSIINAEEFGFQANNLVGQREAPETDLHALVCYEYVTRLAEGVCIDVDSYLHTGREQVCSGQDIISSSQGGPVAFTHVEVRVRPVLSQTNFPAVSPEFVATIRNVGGGTVLAPSTDAYDTAGFEAACRLEVDSRLLNGVAVSGSIFGYPLTCEPSIVRLRDGEGRVRCSIDVNAFKKDKKTMFVDKCADPAEYNTLTQSQKTECDGDSAAALFGNPLPSLDFSSLVPDCLNSVDFNSLNSLNRQYRSDCTTFQDTSNLMTLQRNIMTVLSLEARYVYRNSATHKLTIRKNEFKNSDVYTGQSPKQKGYAYDSNGNVISIDNGDGTTSLLTKCDQFVANPEKAPGELQPLNPEFGCGCTRNECVAMDDFGYCVYGLCPGNFECCDKSAYESFKKAVKNSGQMGGNE